MAEKDSNNAVSNKLAKKAISPIMCQKKINNECIGKTPAAQMGYKNGGMLPMSKTVAAGVNKKGASVCSSSIR
jgi:hypothetical protein